MVEHLQEHAISSVVQQTYVRFLYLGPANWLLIFGHSIRNAE